MAFEIREDGIPQSVPATGDAQLAATRSAAAASIAGGIIAAAGRPFSLEDALKIFEDVYFKMYPAPGHSKFEQWKTAHNPKLPYK